MLCRSCYLAGLLTLLLAQNLSAQNNNNNNNNIPNNPFGAATTVQLPTFGVAIDADGVVQAKLFADPNPELLQQRIAAAKRQQGRDVFAVSKLRKISLVRLEAALRARLDAKQPPDDVMQHLAGLTRVQYVFFLPESRDIIVAGPAEGWLADPAGRPIGLTTGRPTILLVDLAAALRTFPPGQRGRPFVGCTIDPDPEGLVRLQKFQGTIPRVIAQNDRARVAAEIQRGTQQALGMANVRVFGVPANTHLAQVLIEADYRMKLIGIGLEPPPVKMATFVSSLSGPQAASLQRWWFTPDYRCLKMTPDRTAVELVGESVQLQTEDKTIGADGKLMDRAGPPSAASKAYAEAFTKNYAQIATKNVVYGQMRNMVDLLVSAALLRSEDFYGRADWKLGVLGQEQALRIETEATPKQTPCVANTFWKGSRLLSPAGGGVSIVADEALDDEYRLSDTDGAVAAIKGKLAPPEDAKRWWWD